MALPAIAMARSATVCGISAIIHFSLIGWFPGLLIHAAVAVFNAIFRKLQAFGGRSG